MMFKKGTLLVAPLVNLEQVEGDRGVLYCIPLYVAGTSGAPARIVFEEEV
jgi:kynurenine formamidase